MYRRALALLALLAACTPAWAQAPQGCKRLPQDRSITFCEPEGVSVSNGQTLTGWVNDSLPHTTSSYLDDVPDLSNAVPDDFGFGFGFNHDDRIHTVRLVVRDAKGTFSKTFSWRESLELPCSIPDSDRTIRVCQPDAFQIGTAPVHFAAVARSSVSLRFVQVYVDGKNSGTSSGGTSSLKLINIFKYLPVGQHRVTFQATDVNGGKFKSTSFNIQVVDTP